MLPKLLDQIPADQAIGPSELANADAAYGARGCLSVIAAWNTDAITPARKNIEARKPGSDGAISRNEAVNALRYLGLAI